MQVQISIVNESKGYRIYDEVENWDMCENPSEVYHAALKEYGRCTSKVYIDKKDGAVAHIGWHFLKKCFYEDTKEPYSQGAWICPVEKIIPKQIINVEIA